MIIIGDEHLSPRIVRAVSEVALRKGWRFDNVTGSDLCSLEDEDWIESFAKVGGNAIVSADRAMLKRPTLIEKISDLGIVGIYLPAEWGNARRQYQAAHILYWWPRIEAVIEASEPGAAWIVPKGFAATSDLRQHIEKSGSKQVTA
ncbi:hypothetical protein IB265_14215 [Ensifer sp. ENS10]|uniref:PIN-like domain-containing protein n=1 Tax=Ensifer sp. ENS10 TaxID=2769286 RepID=UPI00177FF81E|nr:hypothetical protein [Ensifer sp. ENS10]MBD9507939.1 hypothetical protein [Ensifer sp. ENS10]